MNKSARSPSVAFVLALFLAGCFGGDEDTPTSSNTGNGNGSAPLKPGLYVGDYSPYDTGADKRGWASEFTLGEGGDFRFFWILDNQPVGDVKGKWVQQDSNVRFTSVSETWLDQGSGFFVDSYPAEDDTNLVKNVTETSFTRKEWTLMRQKPYWVTYTRRDLPRIGDGTYRFSAAFPRDSLVMDTVKIDIGLAEGKFDYKYKENDTVSFEADAKWYQVGSILITEQNRARNYIDSLQEFEAWDTIPGALLQRVDSVTADRFYMWSPGGFFAPGTWDEYKKSP